MSKSRGMGFGIGTLAIGLFIGLGAGALSYTRTAVQPYPFNHEVHVKGADCVLCHQGARTGQVATIPSLEFCTGCHATAPGKSPTVEQRHLWEHLRSGEGEVPEWTKLMPIPEHVRFSHRRHVTVAQMECEVCHGDMASQQTPPSVALNTLKMRDCIACHQNEQVTTDCTACHR